MATNRSLIASQLQGMIGKELVFREWAGKMIVSRAPQRTKKTSTPAQQKTRDNFQIASRYARGILQNPDMTAAYAAVLRPRQNIYSRALEDCINPPVVVSIGADGYSGKPGDLISVRATDDFRVTMVFVEIYAANGSLLEKVNAVVTTNGIDWSYVSTLANSQVFGSRIKATATDLPGNEGSLEVLL